MLRFDTKPRRRLPGSLSRGMQLRIISLVVGLGFVLATMNHLRTPQGAAALQRLMHGGPPPVAESDVAADDLPEPLLTAEQLATIRDNTFFRKQELDAWFALFAKLKAEGLANITPPGPLTYAQLTRQPHVYRGRPIRVAGAVRRVERVPADENDLGIESLYRLIMQGQGGEVWPTTLYALAPPDGAPFREPIDLPIEATGVFFKNWSYRWQDGLGISPVILVHSVTVLRDTAPVTDPSETVSPAWAIAGAAALAGGALLVLWLRQPSSTASATTASDATLDFSQLAEHGDA